MKLPIYLLLSLALLAPASAAQRVSPPTESTELRARCDPSLLSLRGGSVQQEGGLSESERAALCKAEAASPGLSDLRAGDSTEVLLIIVIVLLIVLLI